MVTYEITATVEPQFAEEYEKYMLDRHIADLLATGHFASATISRSGDRFRIRYEAFSRQSLDQYLEKGASRLRKDAEEHFPGGVELSREIWDVIAAFPSNNNGS